MSAKIKNEQLLAYLFDDKSHVLAGLMSRWLDASRHFQEFAKEYRDKIRKKIRITQSESAVQDLTAELEVACQLVQHKPFTVTYEPYGSQKTRGPDFGVTFKSHHFNVEVTRIDSTNLERLADEEFDSQQAALRLMDTVCDKLGQMRPGMSNVLVVMTDSDFFAALELEQAMVMLKDGVEKKEAGLYGRYGFEKPADFFKNYLHLSGMLVCTITEPDEANQLAVWLNNQAKHALSAPLQTNLERSLRKV